MNLKYLRFGLSLVLVGFLFVFFVPVVYSSNLYPTACRLPTGGTYYDIPPLCLFSLAGLKSIGDVLFGWGGVYGFELGYSASMVSWGASLTTLGVLLFIALPTAVASVCCLAPEIVRKSLPARAGFTFFGAFVFTLSLLIYASMAVERFNLSLATLAVVLFTFGSTMVIYGVRPKIFQIATGEQSQP